MNLKDIDLKAAGPIICEHGNIVDEMYVCIQCFNKDNHPISNACVEIKSDLNITTENNYIFSSQRNAAYEKALGTARLVLSEVAPRKHANRCTGDRHKCELCNIQYAIKEIDEARKNEM